MKRLYAFILKTFLPLLGMTFGICLFFVLMQFLWLYIEDMVGKGVDMAVLAEMLLYAALSLVPMALPLSILLASLMTFGNLGERFELLAMKAAGVSLIRIMRPLIVVISFVSIGAFYFQNIVMPISQVKFYTLLFSIRQASPELDIPEGAFYSDIDGYNFYVRKKNMDTKILYDLMIYDHSEGFENASIILADSGILKASSDKQFLVLSLFSGESFENLKKQQGAISQQAVPYRRETFRTKEIFISFDANFSRIDGSFLQSQYIGKNVEELQWSIDSIGRNVDSVRVQYAGVVKGTVYMTYAVGDKDSIASSWTRDRNLPPDSLFAKMPYHEQRDVLLHARSSVEMIKNDNQFRAASLRDEQMRLRLHQIEWHRKFAQSAACVVFFFIGAALGAIIRKGGIGMPAVISVILFIFYYIVGNVGLKMAKEGVWTAWQGMWLSSSVLAVLGAFLTYKATRDSAMLNISSYVLVLKDWLGRRGARNIEKKMLVAESLNYPGYADDVAAFDAECRSYMEEKNRFPDYVSFWKNEERRSGNREKELISRMEHLVEDGSISDRSLLLAKLMDYPQMLPTKQGIVVKPFIAALLGIVFPLGLVVYLFTYNQRRLFIQDMKITLRVNEELTKIVTDIVKKDE